MTEKTVRRPQEKLFQWVLPRYRLPLFSSIVKVVLFALSHPDNDPLKTSFSLGMSSLNRTAMIVSLLNMNIPRTSICSDIYYQCYFVDVMVTLLPSSTLFQELKAVSPQSLALKNRHHGSPPTYGQWGDQNRQGAIGSPSCLICFM